MKRLCTSIWCALLILISSTGTPASLHAAQEEVEKSPFAELLLPPSNAATLRQIQSRRIVAARGEEQLYMVCISALQDLGFNLNKQNQALGFARGVKDREAKAPDQALAMNILNVMAVLSGHQPTSYEENQTINVMVVITPAYTGNNNEFDVRVTFHRFLRQPFRVRAEILDNPDLYQSFFALLSKVMFLEEHQL